MVTQVWRIASRIILTPLILAQIGLTGYGVWTLLFTICRYVNAVDANFGVAYNKYTAEYDARGDYGTLSEIVGAGIVLVGSIAVAAFALFWAIRLPLLRLLQVPETMLDNAALALMIILASVALRMSFGCAFPILNGLQRMDLRDMLGILASVIEFVVSIVLLYRGWRLLGLAIGHFVGQVTTTVMAYWLCRRLRPELAISPWRSTRKGLGKIAALGGRFQFLSVAQLLVNYGTRLVVSGLLGPAALGIMELADKLIRLGRAVGHALVAPILPAVSNLRARGDIARMQALLERGTKLVSMTCLPCFAFLAIFADRLLLLWTGETFELAAWTVRMIAPVAYLNMLTGMGTAALRSRGNIRVELSFALVGAAILVLLYYPGYLLAGYAGMVTVEVLAGIAAVSWFMSAFARMEHIDFKGYVRETIVRPLTVLGPVLVLVGVLAPWMQIEPMFARERLNVLLDMTVWGVMFAAVVGLTAWFGLLNAQERAMFVRLLPGRGGPASSAGETVA